MSESNNTALQDQIASLADSDHAAQVAANSAPSESVPVKLSIDPLVLFQQIEQLRKDGVDEETIRKAFADFMAQATQTQRRAANVMKRHRDSTPMPSQKEINEMYEARYKGVVEEGTVNPQVAIILEAMENSNKVQAVKNVRPPLKTRIAYYIARQLLAASIFVCRTLGVK